MTITIASASVTSTSRMESPTTVVESKAMAYSRPGGKFFDELLQRGFGLAVNVESVGIRKLLHADAHAHRMAEYSSRCCSLSAPTSAWPTSFSSTRPFGGVLHDNVVEFLRARKPAHHAHRNLEGLFASEGGCPSWPAGISTFCSTSAFTTSVAVRCEPPGSPDRATRAWRTCARRRSSHRPRRARA